MHMYHNTNRRGKEKMKPNLIGDYDTNMSGIDRSDQKLSYNSALRQTIRWYKKCGVQLIEIYLEECFYLYTACGKNVTIKHINKFRKVVVKWLIVETVQPRQFKPQFHYLAIIPPSRKKEIPTRVFKVCCSNKIRRETRYMCAFCEGNPPMCVEKCFQVYHPKLGVAVESDMDSDEDV